MPRGIYSVRPISVGPSVFPRVSLFVEVLRPYFIQTFCLIWFIFGMKIDNSLKFYFASPMPMFLTCMARPRTLTFHVKGLGKNF